MGNVRIQLGIIFVLVLFSNSSLMTNHGLSWGVDVGNRFDFIVKIGYNPRQMDLDQREVLLDLRIYMEVRELINLSEPVADASLAYLTQIFMNSDIFLSNDTSFSTIDRYVNQVLEGATAVPLGNWSLLNEIIDNSNYNLPPNVTYTAIDDTDYWGYFYEDLFLNSTETWKWRKTDGTLHSVKVLNSSHERLPDMTALDFTVERVEPGQSPLIYLGLGIGVMIIAALVILLRKR